MRDKLAAILNQDIRINLAQTFQVVREWYRSLRPAIDAAKDMMLHLLNVKGFPSGFWDELGRSPSSTTFIPFLL